MTINAEGTAIIEHSETNERYEIDARELNWEGVGNEDRGVGNAYAYHATFHHGELGQLNWYVSEYPVGSGSFRETDVGAHRLIKDIDYRIERQPWFDDEDPSTFPEVFKKNPEWTKALSGETLVSYLVTWFHHYYEDPANDTPYNGREGGYLYVKGGPYNAEEELRESFEGLVPEDALLESIDEVEREGLYEWAPSQSHADSLDFYDEAEDIHDTPEDYSIEELREIASSSEPVWSSPLKVVHQLG